MILLKFQIHLILNFMRHSNDLEINNNIFPVKLAGVKQRAKQICTYKRTNNQTNTRLASVRFFFLFHLNYRYFYVQFSCTR